MPSLEQVWQLAEQMRALGLGVIVASEPDGWEVEITTTEALYEQGYRGVYRKDATVAEALMNAANYVLGGQAEVVAGQAAPGHGGESAPPE